MRITQEQQQQLQQLITTVEQKTDAEIVLVIASQSDHYHYIPTLWATLIALLIPPLLLLTPYPVDPTTTLLIQLTTALSLTLLFRWQPLQMRLIPRHIKNHRASRHAQAQFLQQGLTHTTDQTGILVFLSIAENHAEIIADQGINTKVSPGAWDTILQDLIQHIKQRQPVIGLQNTITACGQHLIQHVPATHQRNQLPNHLILID